MTPKRSDSLRLRYIDCSPDKIRLSRSGPERGLPFMPSLVAMVIFPRHPLAQYQGFELLSTEVFNGDMNSLKARGVAFARQAEASGLLVPLDDFGFLREGPSRGGASRWSLAASCIHCRTPLTAFGHGVLFCQPTIDYRRHRACKSRHLWFPSPPASVL